MKGGMDLHGKHLLEGLVQKGHKITVISTKHPSSKEFENKNGIDFYYLKNTTFGSYGRGWKRECIQKLLELNNADPFHIIISQSFSGYPYDNYFKKKLGIPMVAIIHGAFILGLNSRWVNLKSTGFTLKSIYELFQFLYTYFFIQNTVLKFSDHLICVSKKTKREVQKYHFIKHKKTTVVYYGIDCNKFRPDMTERVRIRNQFHIKDNEIILLTIGTVNREKGHHLAIESLRILLKKGIAVKLMIGGDGPFKDALRKRALYFNINKNIIFCGHIPNEETPGYYNASDIFVFPTLRYESFGIVLAEAMACGKPIIASDIGSIPEVIDNGINGILIPPGKYKELSKQIEFLSRNKKFTEELSRNAILKAREKFNLNEMVEDTQKVFENIILE